MGMTAERARIGSASAKEACGWGSFSDIDFEAHEEWARAEERQTY